MNVHSADDFEVLHAGRVYPDGDAAALIREQLQRVLREAERIGVFFFVEPVAAKHEVCLTRAPRWPT